MGKEYLLKIPEYLHYLKDYYNAGTAKKYTEVVKEFAENTKKISGEPTPEDAILSYIYKKRDVDKISVNTANYRMAVLKSFFKYIRYDIDTHKIRPMREPITGVIQDNHISYEELKKMLNFCEGDNKLMVTILLVTGARLSEACMIKYRDIVINSDKSISITIVTLKRRGYNQRKLKIRPEWAVKIIEEAVLKNTNKDSKLWNETPGCLRERIYIIAKKAGLKGVHPHTFRHALATYLLNIKGASPGGVQKTLGHASLETTSRYSHGGDKDIDDTLSSLE